MNRNVQTVTRDTLLTDLFDKVSTATIPVAVTDEKNRLYGVLVRGAVIGALAGNNGAINDIHPQSDNKQKQSDKGVS